MTKYVEFAYSSKSNEENVIMFVIFTTATFLLTCKGYHICTLYFSVGGPILHDSYIFYLQYK